MTGRTGIDTLGYLLDEPFRGRGLEQSNESQALLTNLATVDEDAWWPLPPGAARSIESISLHVGSCKVMYDHYAFGPATLRWDDPIVRPWPQGSAPKDGTIDWLREVHRRLAEHVSDLSDDAELDRPRRTNWGEMRPTRWIVAALITHDAYHAGEVNHLRSVLGPDDRWRFVQVGSG